MTVGAGSVVEGPFLPDGLVADWPFHFTARSDDEIAVRLVTPTTSRVPVFTVSRANAENPDQPGGVVTIDPPLQSSDGALWISLRPTMAQGVAFEGQARFSPTVMNEALDLAAARDQYLGARLDRAQKAPLGEQGPAIPSAPVRAGTLRIWSADGSAERTDVSYAALLAAIANAGGGGGAGGRAGALSLADYISPSLALTDDQIAAYPDKGGWTDVSPMLRLALAAAGDLGLILDAAGLTGNFYIDPATPLLVRFGCGYTATSSTYPTLGYVSDGAGNIDDVVQDGGLNWIVDPLGPNRKVPKFALQGRTTVTGLSIVGVGLSKSRLLTMPDLPGGYPTIVGGDEFFTDAPVIVTDHQHDHTGAYTGPGANNKVGSVTLECSVLGLMQCVYIGDPHPSEEPLWSAYTASGLVTGTGGNDITVYSGPALRLLGLGRKTSTRQTCDITLDQPRWTGVTQDNSGKLDNYSWIKFVQQYGVGIDAWHRAVGSDWDIKVRGLRYGCRMQAGYSPEGPTWAPPAVGSAVALDALVSAVNGDAFLCVTAGNYATRPQASGDNYNVMTRVFTDPASTLQWTFMCRQPDTGKYNSIRISVAGERIIQPVYVHVNAFLQNAAITAGGHFMDEYNLKGESGAAVDIRSHYLLAGSIDKAVYDPWINGRDYDYGDKISDGAGDVWACSAAGRSTTPPTLGGVSDDGRFHDGDLRWIFRNGGWKAFGDQPYARVTVAGIIQEISGPLFRNTKYDGHQSFTINGNSAASWSQAAHNDALIINKSYRTSIKHINSQTYVSGKADRIYDVVDEARLHVGLNDYYGYDLSDVSAGDYPRQIGSSKLSATFFDSKNCMAHDFDYAVPDEEGTD